MSGKFHIAQFHGTKEEMRQERAAAEVMAESGAADLTAAGNASSAVRSTAAVPARYVSAEAGKPSFADICRIFKENSDREFARRAQAQKRMAGGDAGKPAVDEADAFVELENRAIIGVPETVTTIMEQIQTFVDNHGYQDADFPEHYRDLHLFAREEQRSYLNITHAIFHEIYGFKALACWQKYPDSYAAQIIGTAIWIHTGGRHVRMPFAFSSVQEVEKMIRSLTRQKEDAIVNLYNTVLEIDLYTGERVTLTVRPDVRHDVVTLRRFLIGRVTVDDLGDERRRTIPQEAVPLIKALSKTHCNVIIVGPPGTGKSTSLKALLAERADHYTGAIVEKHYELAASRDFPEKKLIERVTRESTFHHAMDQVLRFDVDYAIIGEVRRVEAEGAMLACERLMKGFGSTFHTWKPETIPSQFARMIVSQNPGARFEEEEKRVAENIDIVIEQSQDATRTKKRFKSVREMRYNRLTGEISTHELMRWNADTDTWSYRADLSGGLLREMRDIDRYWADIAVSTLERLEAMSPIPPEEGVIVYNPAEADPQYRIARSLERLERLMRPERAEQGSG
ncbi:ATPase, T2SS/T4P/T4SS family [Paenibacillus hamazuiensis]|uniref:ATPase, T2SS/T4P/T4SS family n=1 Tax=Paenibacillus hamazuiensis TaxID=2936508 RepID=UPI00200C3EB0|nr:ATPase, T2SS/T4P/T4SS family [Paenibacillus hamazuiensis]